MPAPFSAVHIPFISGARQDLGKLAQDNPAQLRQAQNVVFTKKGHIAGRPGLVSREAQVQLAPNVALGGTLSAQVATATPIGIVASGFPAAAKSDIDTPLICYQGQSYYNRANLWEYAGIHWSLRQTKSVALDTHDPSGTTAALRASSVPCGIDVVGTLTTVGTSTGVPFVSPAGEVKYISTNVPSPGSSFNSASRGKACAALNNLFWKPGTPSVVGMFTAGAGPTTTTEVTITGLISADGGLDVCTDGTFFYIATGGGAGPGTSNIHKVDSTGAVLQTLSLTWAAGDMSQGPGMAICYDPTSNRLGVAAIQHVTGAVASKIITLVAGTMADAGLELTHTGVSGVTLNAETICAGLTHNGKMSVMFSMAAPRWNGGGVGVPSGTVYIGGRLFTAATETAFTTLNGAVNSFGFGQTWDPLFAGQVVANRTLVGVQHGFEITNRANQWIVMDFTEMYGTAADSTVRTAVAAGQLNGFERITPSSVFCNGTQLQFAVSEGVLFSGIPDAVPSNGTGNVSVVRRASVRRITLETQGVQAVHVHDTTLLSGQLMHVFDGHRVSPHHFPEERPYIFNGGNGFTYTSAGGALAAGSYTYQATWESVNARGQTIRSGASAPLTVTGVTANQQVTLHVTKPQLGNHPVSVSKTDLVRVRLWATQTDPTNNAPKYLVTETVVTTSATGFDVTMVHADVATGVEEQLYETTDTLSDMRAPGADRGIAVVAERVWCADQNKLYASKIIRPNIAVSWNTEDTNVLSLPSTLGTIQGLAAVNQSLVVLCSRGAAVVTGPGVDDTGAGPGWALQIIDGVPGMGVSSPRSCVSTPAGAVFQAQDGDLWLASSSGQAVPMSRPLRDNALINSSTPIDVVNVSPTPVSNAMLIAHGTGGVLRVLDLEMGQWGTWKFTSVTPTNGLFLASINGSLWIQTTSPSVVFSVDEASATTEAALGGFVGIIETGDLKPSNPTAHGWGRIRSVILNELRLASDTDVDVRMQVFADQNNRTLMDKTRTTNPTNTTTFPGAGDGVLEFRTTVQRCAHARVLMTITPALFNAEGLDLWVANTGERAPSNNRS
jgi:hypothetical protein